MASPLRRANDAIFENPPIANGRVADIHITRHGSDFYYAVCAFMGFLGLMMIAFSLTKHRTDRLFFYLTAAINITASIAYYAMGSNLGFTPIGVEFERFDDDVFGFERQVFWVRYVDWFVTTPLLILDLLLTAGVPAPTILWTIFMDEVMIVTGLVGAITETGYKWGFFAFGCAAMLNVFWTLIFQGRKYARHLGKDIHRCYVFCGLLTLIVWVGYPVCWGLSEGANIIAPDSEAVFYGALDIVAKPFFSFALILFHRKIDPARMGLKFRDYDEDFVYSARGIEGTHRLHGPERHKEQNTSGEGVRAAGVTEEGPAANGAATNVATNGAAANAAAASGPAASGPAVSSAPAHTA